MTLKFDRDLLVRLGLGVLSDRDAAELLVVMRETLKARVGVSLTARLTSAQLDEFMQALDSGDPDASSWLDEHVADHSEVVRTEFDVLCAEVVAAEGTILSLTGNLSEVIDEVDASHRGSDPSPTLVGTRSGAWLIVSPLGQSIISVNARCDELYARRGDHPAVVLHLPDGYHIDVSTVWCNDEGEVRVRFSDFADLRWHLADRPTSAVRGYTKALYRARPALRLAEGQPAQGGFIAFTCGSWHVRDGQFIEVTNQDTEVQLSLEQLHDGPHSNAINPHFIPDGSQLVAVYNTRNHATSGGVNACSTHYLDTIEPPDVIDVDDAPTHTPWEHTVLPNKDLETQDETQSRRSRDLILENVGYDLSSTRAVVTDGRAAHLYRLPDWSRIRTAPRPDRSARAARIAVPGDGPPLPCWAGRSVVVAASDGTVWCLDLQRATELEFLAEASRDRSPVAAIPSADAAILVHANREIITVDATGTAHSVTLAGDSPAVAADMTADGLILIGTRSGLELWSGTELHASVEIQGPEIIGIAACAASPEWSLLWFADGTVASARTVGRRIHVTRGSIPHQPSDGFSAEATSAVMVDVGQWYLIQPRGEEPGADDAVVVGPDRRIDIDARCLAYMGAAGLVVAGTASGLEFIASGGQDEPLPLELPAGVGSIAVGDCPRSLAVATPGAVWMVRLLA